MRIISGQLKGRGILVPKNFDGRPTTDFAREGLFNVLNNLVEYSDIRVLDLFAGTGAFGLECISRGAVSAMFVDISPMHVKFIGENLRTYQLKNGVALKADVLKFIRQEATQKFDVIFADPPFDMKELELLPDAILNAGLLEENGIFVLEHGKRNDFSMHPDFTQVRAYSNVRFSFFSKD